MEQNNLCHGHTSHSILFQVMVMPSPFSPFHHFSYHRAECLSFSRHLLAKKFLDLQYQLRSVHKLVLLVVILCPSLHREHCHNLLTCQGGVMKQRPLKSDCLCYYFVSSHIYPRGLKSWLSKILKLTKGCMQLNFCQRQLHARILLKFVKSTILDVHLSCQPCNNKPQTNCCFGTSYQPRQLNKRKKWK